MQTLAEWVRAPDPAVNTLILRMDAPMMSFGGVMVDGMHGTQKYPLRSTLAGLLANALGYDRTDFDLQEHLQDAFTFACRWDVQPQLLSDYQTVDLGSVKMRRKAWKSDFTVASRDGGKASDGTHQTTKEYWASGVLTVAVHFEDAQLCQRVAQALLQPARTLFYGRKTCIPAAALGRAACTAESAAAALLRAPVLAFDAAREQVPAQIQSLQLETDLGMECAAAAGKVKAIVEQPRRLDMRNRVHVDTERRMRTVLQFAVCSPEGGQ